MKNLTRDIKIFKLSLRGIIFLILVTIISIHGVAQRYNVTQYTEASGLGHSTIYDIKQDSTGKMWFATRAGITSYDGTTWKNFNALDGLAKKIYAFIEIDEKGKIWSLPLDGHLYLKVFTGDKWENIFVTKNPEHSGNYNSLLVNYEDKKPNIYIGTESKGLFVNRLGEWTSYSESNGLLSNDVLTSCFIGDSLFVATDKGINIIYNHRVSILDNKRMGFPDNNIIGISAQRIVEDDIDKSILWVAGENWLGYILDQEFILVSSNINITVDNTFKSTFLIPNQNDGIYFGNVIAAMYLDFETKKISFLGKKNGLISDGASTVFIDQEKNLWIASLRGLNKISSKRFVNFTKENGLFKNEVTSVEEISPGNYVFGHEGALTFYKEGVLKVFEFTDSSDNWLRKRVMDICIDNDRNIWFATGFLGLGFIDSHKNLKWFGEEDGLPGLVTSVISTSTGIIYACSDKGFYFLSGNKFEQVKTEGTWSSSIRKIFEAKDGSIYCTTFNDGIYKIKDGIQEKIRYLGDEKFNSTYSFLESPEGDIFVGTTGGLLKIQDSILVRTKDILIERPVYLILNDNKGQLWFGTDNGVFKWNGTDLKHFSVYDGLAGLEINRDAGLLDSKNNLWFGTNNGLTLYRESLDNSVDSEIPSPNIFLSFVEAKGDTLPLTEKITLNYNENDLTFNFKGISFIDENRIYYKCKLEGFDKDWTPEFRSLQNSYRYTNLKPGKYRFCVKARNALGIWSDSLCSNVIIIKSPFWLQWWFIALSAIFILLIVSTILKTITHKKQAIYLEKTVQKRTKELEESKEKAEESDRLKSAFLANMSHEIRTPMNGILGFTDLLKEADLTGKERKKYIRVIEKSGERMLNTINDIIDISRIESGEMKLNIKPTNINSQLESLYDFFKPEAEKNKILLSFKPGLDNNLANIHTDPEKFEAIFTNLIKNALKFTNEGIIEFGYSIEDERIHSYVRDSGKGIASDKLKRIFDRFAQEEDSDSFTKQGSGLGLSIVKAYAKLLEGEIWVESKKGDGSTFHFTIPYQSIEKHSTANKMNVKGSIDKKNNFANKTILVVEDDVASSEYLKVVLRNLGINNISLANNGEMAIKQCKENPAIDLVLMDINMPVMGGYDATKAIKAFRPDLPIIAQTAYALAGDREKSLEARCDDYITKPVKKAELLEKIEKFLG